MGGRRNFCLVFVVLTLAKAASSEYQYPGFYPASDYNDVYSPREPDHVLGPYPQRFDYNPVLPQRWMNLNPMGTPNAQMPPVVLGSVIPPIYEQVQFAPGDSEFWNSLHRGRGDIDPVDDAEGLGYFYPKPKIAFDLPSFTPLGTATPKEPEEDVTVATTTEEESTEKVTTTEAATTVKS